MLTLANSLKLGAYTVYRDKVFRAGQSAYTATFFALPDAPRLAMDSSGLPEFDFLWYRMPPGGTGDGTTAGGLVTLTTELGIAPEERSVLETGIREALANEALPDLQMLPVPFKAGSVALAFAGESGERGELATMIAGKGPARFSGSERASFAVELSADGAALLWQTLEAGLDLFHIRYDLVFEHRLTDVELRLWCDARRSHEALVLRSASGPLDGTELRQTLKAQSLAGYELIAEQPLTGEHRAALDRLAENLLESALSDAFLSLEPDASAEALGVFPAQRRTATLRPFDPAIEARLNFKVSESFPSEQHAVLEAVLDLGGGREVWADRVRLIDLDGGFFRVHEVKIFCTVDFTQDLIDAVKLWVFYHEAGRWGRVERTGEYLFRAGAQVATFRTELADPDKRRCRYAADVYYRGSPEPQRFDYPSAEGNILVLDLDGLGALRVSVELRDVPFDVIRKVIVDLEYQPKGLSHRLILDGEQPAGVWQAVIRDTRAPYRYRVAWLTHDERRLEGEWQESSQPALFLDAPRDLVQTAQVRLVAAGDFSHLAQIIIDLRTVPDNSADQTQFAFTRAGEGRVWEPRVADRTSFRYQARHTLIYQSGHIRELDWTNEERPVLIVRDWLRFEVRVLPRLLDLGATIKLALLGLEYKDEAEGISEQATLVLRERTEEPVWSFNLGALDRRRYRYRLTLVPAEGSRIEIPWQETQDALLVLRPINP
ncbi:MAG: hypothetical protein ACREV1_00310 [Gammaproteobacteria bacterium]